MKEMNNKNQTNELLHSNSDEHVKKKAIAHQLRRARERDTCKLVPSSEPITQFNRREQERVEHESSEHEEVEHIRSKHERSAHEKNRSRTPENATNTPSKRSIAQQARRERERIKRA
ncbi:hypothetical protein F8M41_019046 [Gigaspora margarita]|uniref:Uncharacterized protein n=1 Tax=Gigaspora margarita TaxID=4874 RepID=A0A8H4EKR5_GIGMA|nr:hypothetical protein F8M41_019046 [Gigaspora margarita]